MKIIKNHKKDFDEFIQIAAGGKKMNGEVKRMAEISPLAIERKELSKTSLQEIAMPQFDEAKSYADFLAEKKALRAYYEPYLKNYARKITREEYSIVDFSYRKETEEDKADFTHVLGGLGVWTEVKIPHYDGPDGRWNAFYRTELTIDKIQKDKYYLLDFEAVDYIAEVYINGRMADRHIGFFAPFTVNITDYIHEGKNTLLVVVKNDITSTGVFIEGVKHYGDKIYGATHLGYDEPNLGWHHCPAGAGIFGKLKMTVAGTSRITNIFVQPDIDKGEITVNTTVFTYGHKTCKYKIAYTVEGRNFKEKVFENAEGKTDPFTLDENYLVEKFSLPNFKLWTQKAPHLYAITVSLLDENGNVIDEKQTHFGMRKFHMDENSTPKGAFYLNNERIMLRGTNEMGHLPRCVKEGNYEQLIDDILIAKVANLNFYRMTQRPVYDDIYTYFDMLGMLCQSDFPLFSYLKPSAVGEALKQVREMELLTRNHPCVIVETFCNETLDKTAWGKEQYNLSRYEIEKFFNAAREVVEIYNPDRVIKYCEGDYAPLPETHGISDFHCYTYWYVSHGMPSGKLKKGYLPPIRP
ncbi:MAG: glycoside hydrolase family 2, partial [Clostridia bacterium]|nr:glycoside hydrolase family 2 [Clostridia bacterium]